MSRGSRQHGACFGPLLLAVLWLLVFAAPGYLFAGPYEAQAAMMDNLRRGVLLSVSWIFLAVGLLLVTLTLRKTWLWLKAVQKTRIPPTRYFNLQLQVRNRRGDQGLHNFDYYPVVVAAAGSADLLLPEVADSGARFRIDYRQGQAQLSADSTVIVNGVPRRHKELKQDDRIIFGPYRLIFKDASIREQSAPAPARPVFAWQFPIVAMLLALSVLFKQAGTVPEDTTLLARAAELQSVEPSAPAVGQEQQATEGSFSPPRQAVPQPAPQPSPPESNFVDSEPPPEAAAPVPAPRSVDSAPASLQPSFVSRQRAAQKPPVLQASVLGSVAPAAVQIDGINPLEGLGFAKGRSAQEIGRTKVRVIPPGRPVEYFKADILFVHAHPDDESIDFGSLMAMASRSSKRIVTLLFTDGESGLDLYPERRIGDIYPARDLSGPSLAQVRVVEATRALSILGSEMYLRWGLENRPYNSITDEVPPEEIIRGWGGEERLVDGLVEILEGFRPTIVVSPDRHSGAHEHFEHEAVGQLVQEALERLRRDGQPFVKGHLVSIDPYQVGCYGGVTAVDAGLRDEGTGLTYRSIQALALREHVTQRDASVIGVSRLSSLPQEYYKALYWDLEGSLEEYLR